MPLGTETLDFITSYNEPSLEVNQIIPNTSALHSFTGNVPPVCETVMTSIRRKMKKSVQFRTVTVYYFPRAQGYSSIPTQDGPTLGMSDKHFLVETYDLMEKLDHGINNHHLHLEQQLSQKECPLRPSAFTKLTGEDNLLTLPLPSVDPPHEEPGRVCLPAKHEKLVGSTIHPVTLRQRKKLLREAGVSKIDAVEEAEAREIRISRTLCGCNCKDFCRPNTCLCSRSEIPCQVDSGSFPCACSEFGCGNPAGRLQFDLAQVKKQRVLRLAQLQIDSTMDRGNTSLGVVNVELIISPAKRTKLSKSQTTQKRVFAKKRPLKREIGKQSSTLVSEKQETEFLLERDEKTEMLDKEASYERVRLENSFNKTSNNNASSENITLSEEKLFTESKTRFREPAQECLIESGFALESVSAVLDTLQNDSNSTCIEDASFSQETTSCSRGFDLDPEDDLDPNCLKLLVIGNENLEETMSDAHLGAVGNFTLSDDLGLKYLGSIRESNSKCSFSLDLKNIDADLELKCEVIESSNDLRSSDDLDLDLKCDVSLNCGSLQRTVSHDIESKSAAVKSIQSSDVGETDFTNERDLDAVSSDLHSALNIDSAHSCSRRSKKVSFSCRSFISRFLPNRPQKTGGSGRASRVTKSSEACINSQGHIVNSQGQITRSRSHHINSKGHYVESQCHEIEFQDHCIKCQGHHIESQGHCVESQGHSNALNGAQVTGVNLTVSAARPGNGDICDIAAESEVKDFSCYGSPFEVIALQEVSSTSEEVSSTQSSTQSSTLEEESCTSKEEDLSPSQCSDNYELHINVKDDLTVVACTGSLLEASSVLT